MALKGQEVASKEHKLALKGQEVALKEHKVALKGQEVALKGHKVALKGHDFSRADRADKTDGASAPEGWFSLYHPAR